MKKYKRGMLFGSWDGLHYGHIRLIERARDLCNEIIICVDSDELIKKTKKRKCNVNFYQRMKDLSNIKGVGRMVKEDVGYGENKKELICSVYPKPDILIKGDDWKDKKWSGEELGVPVLYLPHTPGIHSSDMVRKK